MRKVDPYRHVVSLLVALVGFVVASGCCNSPVDVSSVAQGPAPLRLPSPKQGMKNCCYEETLQGQHVFEMYCAACHNARALAERPFSNYQNAAQHMRVR